jgi:hypothetical protein
MCHPGESRDPGQAALLRVDPGFRRDDVPAGASRGSGRRRDDVLLRRPPARPHNAGLAPPQPPLPEPHHPTPFVATWTLADVVDFEHFLANDDADPSRDRQWFDERIAPVLGDAAHDRRRAFRAWLDLQRERQAGAPTPGQRLQQTLSLLSGTAVVLGTLLGAALAGTWLAQAGDEPVNAPLFWAATVGVQCLLLAIAAIAWPLRRGAAGGLRAAVQSLIVAAGAAMRRLPGERRDALRATLARLAARSDRHAGLLGAPAAALLQRFALAFNAGLLVAMLALHLPLVDLRFGWQSTYPIDASQMHRAVQWVAAPWHWAVPQAQPRPDEVAATRFARGQPAHTLPPDAARAWWPFLVLSIACYGVVLRGALWAALVLVQRRRLRATAFDDPAAHALWRRLAGPLVRTEGGGAPLPAGSGGSASARPAHDCTVLVAQDLREDDDRLRTMLASGFGCAASGWHRIAIDDRSASAPLLGQIAARRPPSILVVAPAERDPIVAVAQLLRAVVQAAAPGADVLLLLAAGDDARLAIWRRFVQIQRLPIGVEALR